MKRKARVVKPLGTNEIIPSPASGIIIEGQEAGQFCFALRCNNV